MTRRIRMGTGQNPGAELSGSRPGRAFRAHFKDEEDTGPVNSRDPKRIIVLGCIKYGPHKTANEIVKYLCAEGCMVPTDIANVYRIIRQMVNRGLIRENPRKPKTFELTKFGEHHCLDRETFCKLMDASKTIIAIKENRFARKPEKSENAEKSLVEAASEALEKIEGVVSEEILAPLRRLINSINKC